MVTNFLLTHISSIEHNVIMEESSVLSDKTTEVDVYDKNKRFTKLLIAIIIVLSLLLVFSVVQQSSRKTEATLVVAPTFSPPTVSPIPTIPVTQEGMDSSPSLVPTQRNGFFEIKELGIKIPITSELKDLIYTYDYDHKIQSASFSTISLEKAGEYCRPEDDALGSISIYYKSDFTSNNPADGFLYEGTVRALTKTQYDKQGNLIAGITAKEFKDFYVVYSHPQSVCLLDEEAAKTSVSQTDQIRALLNLIPSIEVVQ